MDIEKRNHSIKSDYGSNDYFIFFKKNNPDSKVIRKDYGSILKEFNSHLRDGLSEKGIDIVIPSRLGRVELRKIKTSVTIGSDGEIVNNLPTNWKATRDLWKESPESKEKNVKIKFTNEHTDGYTFKISYLKGRATFRNKSIYKIRFNRLLKRNLSKSIFEGKIDAFINPN
jgi:hypothetical protein